jgi:hypothetical protein
MRAKELTKLELALSQKNTRDLAPMLAKAHEDAKIRV